MGHCEPVAAGGMGGAARDRPPELGSLYGAFGRRVHSICRSYLHDQVAAEDAVQEVFLRVGERVVEVRTATLRQYIDAVARNVCREELRRRRTVTVHDTLPDDVALDPADIAAQRQLVDDLWVQLPLRDRVLLVHQFAGYSRSEIARRLGTSAEAVHMGLVRARQRARRLLTVVVIAVRSMRRRARARRVAVRATLGGVHVARRCAVLWLAVVTATTAPVAWSRWAMTPAGFDASSSPPPAAAVIPSGIPTGVTGAALTVSPAYAADRTVYLSGGTASACSTALCHVLYRSGDGGAGWSRLPAHGFSGGRILVVADGGSRPALFASGARGLQRSDDGGITFRTVLPDAGPAAVVPAAAPGVVAAIASHRVALYHARSGEVSAGPVLPAGDDAVDAVAVDDRHLAVAVLGPARGGAEGPTPTVVLCDIGAGRCTEALTDPAAATLHLVHAPLGLPGQVVAFSEHAIHLGTTRGFVDVHGFGSAVVTAVAAAGEGANAALVVAVRDPRGGGAAVLRSADGGRTFTRVASGDSLAAVRDLAVAPDGRLLLAGQLGADALLCSLDGGHTWAARCTV